MANYFSGIPTKFADQTKKVITAIMLRTLRIPWENHHGMLMAYILCRKAHGLFVTVTIWGSGQSPPVDNVHDYYSYNGDDSENCAEDITRPGGSRRLFCSGSVSCKQYQIN